MRGRKRPADERARAVGIAVISGASAASEETGIPRTSIAEWMDDPEFVELRQRTKEQVAEEWWAGVQRGFRAVMREFEGDAPLQAKATAAAILFDKLAMVRGEATTRTESLVGDLDDTDKRQLRESLRRVREELVGASTPSVGEGARHPAVAGAS